MPVVLYLHVHCVVLYLHVHCVVLFCIKGTCQCVWEHNSDLHQLTLTSYALIIIALLQ